MCLQCLTHCRQRGAFDSNFWAPVSEQTAVGDAYSAVVGSETHPQVWVEVLVLLLVVRLWVSVYLSSVLEPYCGHLFSAAAAAAAPSLIPSLCCHRALHVLVPLPAVPFTFTWPSGALHSQSQGSLHMCPERGNSPVLHLEGYVAVTYHIWNFTFICVINEWVPVSLVRL